MSVAYANPDLYSPEEITLRRYLGYSLFLHGLLAGAVVVSIVFHFHGMSWGDVGGGSEGNVKVNLVGSVGLPMPKPPEITESRTFDPTDSLYKAEPKPPKPPEPPKPEVKIPDFKKEKRLPPSPKSRTFEEKTPPPDNAVPGHGGQMNLPTGTAQTQGAAAPGVNIQGQGGGDFASRYGWYIEAVRRKVSQNWDQSTIESGVRTARTAHCVYTFSIDRSGKISNIRLLQTSGNSSMDTSGYRALLSIDTMSPLPGDYSGSYVNVTFDFDLGMTR